MAAKNGGKTIFWEKSPDDSADIKNLLKNSIEITVYTVSKINAFLFVCFTQKFKMASKIAGKRFLRKVSS